MKTNLPVIVLKGMILLPHNDIRFEVDTKATSNLMDIVEMFHDNKIFVVSQINQLRRIVNDYNIPVMCYGLKSDFLSNLFPGSKRLLETSDNIRKLRTVCGCGAGANFNVRKDKNGNYITQGEQVCIDDGGNYDSECALCFMEHVMGIDTKHKSRIKKK